MAAFEYWGELISVGGTLAGTLVGVLVGYWLSNRSSEQQFRRSVLRDIALEYRSLSNTQQAYHVQGLIRAGIGQCSSNSEIEYVLNLIDDLGPRNETGIDWRPGNKNYLEYFRRIRADGVDYTSGKELRDLKAKVEAGLPSTTNQ